MIRIVCAACLLSISGRFTEIDGQVTTLEEMTGADYVDVGGNTLTPN